MTTAVAGISLIAGKQNLAKSSIKHIVVPPTNLPSSCDDTTSDDLDASFDAFVKQRGILADEKGYSAEENGDADADVNANEISMDSAGDVFFDAKETLSPTK